MAQEQCENSNILYDSMNIFSAYPCNYWQETGGFFSKLAHIEVDAIIFSQFERERKLSVIISETLQGNMFSVCLL